MENLKAYIESGVLELYVLGDLSPEEALQVEEMASQHPEVRDEIAAIEQAMEQYAMQNAVEPSADVETRLFEKLGLSEVGEQVNVQPEPIYTEEPRIIRLDGSDAKVRTLRYALVACIALLVDADLLGKALNDWYAQGAQNYEIWAQKYPITFNGEMNEVTKKQKTWCDMAEIAFTPTILVNGYKLPAPYLLEDIKYLIT